MENNHTKGIILDLLYKQVMKDVDLIRKDNNNIKIAIVNWNTVMADVVVVEITKILIIVGVKKTAHEEWTVELNIK